MKTAKTGTNRHETRRNQALQRMTHIAPFIEGSLCRVKRKGCQKPGWHLTFKTKGKTRTVYVPVAMATEVTAWTKEFKQLKKLIRTVTRHSLALIRRHVANQRVENRSRVSISTKLRKARPVASVKRSRG